jgi:hypothetical protein
MRGLKNARLRGALLDAEAVQAAWLAILTYARAVVGSAVAPCTDGAAPHAQRSRRDFALP